MIEPTTEIPTGADGDDIIFSDGRSVPAKAVRALTEYNEGVWQGAVVPEARAAVAYVVLSAVETEKLPVLRTNYPFCLEPNPSELASDSPCILRSGHRTKHADNNDGVWE